MAQRRRFDGPGVRHHVMNRGIGKRLMFASERDRRTFKVQLACAFRRNQLQPEAFSILGSHFHMLVRTEEGTLSEGMRRIQNGYSRWFNRRNRRDGYLARSRFRSRPVTNDAYFLTVLPYIDHNPVKAGLCSTPGAWMGGSARHYLTGRFPPWLRTKGVHGLIAQYGSPDEPVSAVYARLVRARPTRFERQLIESSFSAPHDRLDALDHVFEAPGSRALGWLEEKARNADGLRPSRPLVAADAIEEAVASGVSRAPLAIKRSRKTWNGWKIVLFGLQNSIAGLGGSSLASRHGVSGSTAGRYVAAHRDLLLEHTEYAEACRRTTLEALARTYPRLRIS